MDYIYFFENYLKVVGVFEKIDKGEISSVELRDFIVDHIEKYFNLKIELEWLLDLFWYLSEIWDYPNNADDKTIEIFTEVFCDLKTLKQEFQDGEITKEEAEKELKEVLLKLNRIKDF